MIDCTTCRNCRRDLVYDDMFDCLKYRRLSLFTVKEINECTDYIPVDCEYCRGCAYTKKPFKVVTQLGITREVKFKYCPNCGRQIKP